MYLLKLLNQKKKQKADSTSRRQLRKKTQTGVVSAIGDDKDVIKVKVGDKIMYDKYAGTSVKIESEEFLILKANDIIAIVE